MADVYVIQQPAVRATVLYPTLTLVATGAQSTTTTDLAGQVFPRPIPASAIETSTP